MILVPRLPLNMLQVQKKLIIKIYIGLGILFIFIVIILWKSASPSKITQTEQKIMIERAQKN